MERDHLPAGEQGPKPIIDFEETNARLQAGLRQCHKMVASYRAKLSPNHEEPVRDKPV